MINLSPWLELSIAMHVPVSPPLKLWKRKNRRTRRRTLIKSKWMTRGERTEEKRRRISTTPRVLCQCACSCPFSTKEEGHTLGKSVPRRSRCGTVFCFPFRVSIFTSLISLSRRRPRVDISTIFFLLSSFLLHLRPTPPTLTLPNLSCR